MGYFETREMFMERERKEIAKEKAIKETRAKVRKAFVRLRQMGFIAKMNFLCCGTCGCSEIQNISNKNPIYDGYAFFHHQDNDNFNYNGQLMIRYGALKDSEDDTSIGKMIFATFQREGLNVSWDENPCHCIEINTFSENNS